MHALCICFIILFKLSLKSDLQCAATLVRNLTDLNVLTSNNTRFAPFPKEKRAKRTNELLLFISITSSPHHAHLRHAARFTWLLPCVASQHCDYKFFIDKTVSSSTPDVISEQDAYDDLVFRDSCRLMERHPEYINYGNAPPRNENFKLKVNDTVIDAPDYLWRRMYKIDWKVCFMQYARDHGKMAKYHAFTEDDSFVCTENLLHQCVQIENKAKTTQIVPSFRTGTGMFDGFDDSSTFMTRDVALAFADHYGDAGFNCTKVVDHVNSVAWNGSMWMSWGNSWMKARCDWADVLREHLNMHVLKPSVDCMAATSLVVHKDHTVLAFPCAAHNIIMHHGTAGEVLLREKSAHLRHTCEHMLLIDKVKEPKVMYDLWNTAAVEHTFHDFSEVFLHEKEEGWLKTLQQLADDDRECSAKNGNNRDPAAKDCIFETRRRLIELNKHRHVALFGPTEPLTAEGAAPVHDAGSNSKGRDEVPVYEHFYSKLLEKVANVV